MDDSLKEAIKYISLHKKTNPNINMLNLIEAAAKEFDLNPLQCEFLINKYVMS
jgi:hypothetical protein